VHLRHLDVEGDEVGVDLRDLRQRDAAVRRGPGDGEVGFGVEHLADEPTDDDGVVDHKDAGGRHRPSGTSSPSRASLSRMMSAVKGFMAYSSAPADSARTTWAGSDSVVTMTSGRRSSDGSARTARMKDRPSISGMFQSTRATSGRS